MHDIQTAIAKIDEIHHQLSKSGIYKGYRSVVVAISGIIGICAALLQPLFTQKCDTILFVLYWSIIACINLVVCTLMILYRYLFKELPFEKQKTRRVMVQFISMIIAGSIVTPFLAFQGAAAISLLPGIWALLFGMGIFNIRPYLSGNTIIAALYYFVGALILFCLRFYKVEWLGTGMGAVFGSGQLLSALILYVSEES